MEAVEGERDGAAGGPDDPLRALADRLPLALWIWEVPDGGDVLDARLVAVNRPAVRLRNRPDLDIVEGASVADLDPSPAELADFERVLAIRGTDTTLDLGTTDRTIDGHRRVLRRVAFGLGEHTVGVVVSDVTRPVQAERDRAVVLDRLLEVADGERRRLADALHDEVIARIAASLLSLDALAAHATAAGSSVDADRVVDSVERVSGVLRGTVEQLRSQVFELAPPEVPAGGLADALRRAAEHLFPPSVGPTVFVEVDLPDDTAGALAAVVYRVAVEALTNAARHARAAVVVARVALLGDVVRVEVADDGIGPGDAGGPDEPDVPGHLGVRTMRERCERLGGSLSVDEAEGGGTVVRAELPYAPASGGGVDAPLVPRLAADWRPPEPRPGRRPPTVRPDRLVDTTPDLVFCVAPDLRVHYANPAACSALGVPPVDVVGAPLRSLYPAAVAEQAARSVARVVRHGVGDRYAFPDPLPPPGQEGARLDVVLIPDRLDDGRVVRVWSWLRRLPGPHAVAGVAPDEVAPPQRPTGPDPADAVADLRPPGRVGRAVAASPDLISCVGASGRFQWANPALFHLVGLPAAAMAGRTPQDLGIEPPGGRYREAVGAALATGRTHHVLLDVGSTPGSLVLDVLAVPELDPDDPAGPAPGAVERCWVVARPVAPPD